MHIEFLHDIKDPDTGEPLYHKGQRVHRMTAVCAPYLDRKVAVEIKPARRGTRDWFTERMEQAAMPRQVHANDTSVAAPVLPVGFSIVKRVNGTREQWFIQEVKRSGEAFIYENIPAGCPASVVKQWQELNGGTLTQRSQLKRSALLSANAIALLR